LGGGSSRNGQGLRGFARHFLGRPRRRRLDEAPNDAFNFPVLHTDVPAEDTQGPVTLAIGALARAGLTAKSKFRLIRMADRPAATRLRQRKNGDGGEGLEGLDG